MENYTWQNMSLGVAMCMLSTISPGLGVADIEQAAGPSASRSAHYYIITNNSVSGILSSGKLTSVAYGDYGKSLAMPSVQTDRINEPFGWQQEYRDAVLGLTYLRARYYRPNLRSFMTMDSYSLDNKYAYGYANPVGFVDPSGHIGVWSVLNYVFNGIALVSGIAMMVPTCGASAAGNIILSAATGMISSTMGIGGQILSDTGSNQSGEILNRASSALAAFALVIEIRAGVIEVIPRIRAQLNQRDVKSLVPSNIEESITNELVDEFEVLSIPVVQPTPILTSESKRELSAIIKQHKNIMKEFQKRLGNNLNFQNDASVYNEKVALHSKISNAMEEFLPLCKHYETLFYKVEGEADELVELLTDLRVGYARLQDAAHNHVRIQDPNKLGIIHILE